MYTTKRTAVAPPNKQIIMPTVIPKVAPILFSVLDTVLAVGVGTIEVPM